MQEISDQKNLISSLTTEIETMGEAGEVSKALEIMRNVERAITEKAVKEVINRRRFFSPR